MQALVQPLVLLLFLPQAARAMEATIAAKTSDLFIFTILDDIEENNFRKLSKKPEAKFKLCFDRGKDSSSFYPAFDYMSVMM